MNSIWNCRQGRPDTCGRPGRLIILWPLKPIIFKHFRRTKLLARLCLKARVQIANNFRRNSFARGNTSLLTPNFVILSRVDTCGYQHHISDYSSDVLTPLIGWHPGQLPGWPSPYSGPAFRIFHFLKRKAISYSDVNISVSRLMYRDLTLGPFIN